MDKPRIITLDLGECQHIDEMHQRIKTAFQFPDYYGENWNVFGIRLMEQETTPWWKSKAYPPYPRNSGKRLEK